MHMKKEKIEKTKDIIYSDNTYIVGKVLKN